MFQVVMYLREHNGIYDQIKDYCIIPPQWSMVHVFCVNSTIASMNEFPERNYSGVMCRMQIERDPSFVVNNFCIPSFIVTILAVVAIHSAESADGSRTNKYELGKILNISNNLVR